MGGDSERMGGCSDGWVGTVKACWSISFLARSNTAPNSH